MPIKDMISTEVKLSNIKVSVCRKTGPHPLPLPIRQFNVQWSLPSFSASVLAPCHPFSFPNFLLHFFPHFQVPLLPHFIPSVQFSCQGRRPDSLRLTPIPPPTRGAISNPPPLTANLARIASIA